MKILLTVTLILYSIMAFGQDCEKYFVKPAKTKKKHQSAIFQPEQTIKTKGIAVWVDLKRSIAFSLQQIEDSSMIKFSYIFNGGEGFKNSFVLGKNIEIAFIFDDGTYDIITFDNDATYTQYASESTEQRFQYNFNWIGLTNEFLQKLMTTEIIGYEIKNPFGFTMSSKQKLKRYELPKKSRPKIMFIAQCFFDKTNR